MDFLITFLLSIVVVVALREPIRRYPVLFYALAVVAVAVLFMGKNGMLGDWWKVLILPLHRCMLPLSLFALVMFIGVLPKGSRPDAWLRPIRSELSVIACILCLGHMFVYFGLYASRALAGSLGISTMASFAVACVLFVLLVILGVTSFNFVKQRMGGHTWKNVQRLAYVFFGLVWAHLVFMLAPAASRGGEQAILSVVIYTVIFAAYLVLRLFRARKDKAAAVSAASEQVA